MYVIMSYKMVVYSVHLAGICLTLTVRKQVGLLWNLTMQETMGSL